MAKFDLGLMEKVLIRAKDEWSCAMMECGGQFVQMKSLLTLSVVKSDTASETTVG